MFSLNALCDSGGQPNSLEKCKKKIALTEKLAFRPIFSKMAEIRVPPNFQLMITPRTLELQTSFWSRWNCPELKFMKQDEKNEL